MKTELRAPTELNSLREAMIYFAHADRALAFMVEMRWPNGVTCPRCHAVAPMFLKTRRIWKCGECRRQFSVKVGTVFEDSPLGLNKWLPALWLLANAKNGISSYELARALGVTQKTGWFMLGRIRLAMQSRSFQKMNGTVEVDESFIGGKAGNMHKGKKERVQAHPGSTKAPVVGLLQRGPKGKSRVTAMVKADVRRPTLHAAIHEHVEAGSSVFTDAHPSYRELDPAYPHEVIDHEVSYVRGEVHTNGLENFWFLFKRSLKGTYVSVDPFHLFRYVDEQVFRFNARDGSDRQRFLSVAADVLGKRLTYKTLIGADMNPATT